MPQTLGPFTGRYLPDYELKFWRDGDPRLPVRGPDLRSAIAIQTSKSLDDLSGTFTVTLKGRNARHYIKEMDVARIRLQGHDGKGLTTVMRGVVDTARAGGSADTYASRRDTVIEGRCMGKYLQVTDLFLPVWDPQSLLPTALVFGLGDSAKKVGGNTPFDIFQYLIKRFTFGERNLAGVSGIPNSRFWLDSVTRFDKIHFQVPFLQFDEDDMGTALKRLEVLGFSESWIDEVGRVVYRHPQWDAPVSYLIPTSSLKEWDFPRTDVGCATYFEVIPAGDPGIDSAQAQALRAGRAPVPSSYISKDPTSFQGQIKPEFIIDTDAAGHVTAKGRKNFWYRRQRRLGMRPQQITSPLIFTQEQAQAQAEGLLHFYGRMIKQASVTIPGCPSVRLGNTGRVFGPLDDGAIDRTFYVDQVTHEYVEGSTYDTSLHGSHGRDPWDPKWGTIALPKFDPSKLAQTGGILAPGGAGTGSGAGGTVTPGDIQGLTPQQIIDKYVLPVGQGFGLKTPPGLALTPANVAAANATHGPTINGNRSDHQGPPSVAWATDMQDGYDTRNEEKCAERLAAMFNIPYVPSGGLFNNTFGGVRFQLIHRTMTGGNHFNHVHFGARAGG